MSITSIHCLICFDLSFAAEMLRLLEVIKQRWVQIVIITYDDCRMIIVTFIVLLERRTERRLTRWLDRAWWKCCIQMKLIWNVNNERMNNNHTLSAAHDACDDKSKKIQINASMTWYASIRDTGWKRTQSKQKHISCCKIIFLPFFLSFLLLSRLHDRWLFNERSKHLV